MKKAVLYARVSSDVQKKERTIESQITELKSQIKEGGAVLVKEYVDDGYSGARLDRPALEELRRFVKTPLFDSIYFLNTDRIARDVTYQIIIISEILKQQKQLIINGRDYIETLSDQRNVREADDRLNGDFAQNTGVESINDFSRQPMECLCLQ